MEIQDNPYSRDMDNVYAYFFIEQHSVYIGRTINPKQRDISHRTKNGTVSKFSKKHGVEIPKMTILETSLSLEQGQVREDYYVKNYKSEGWSVLNKAKTGKGSGSLGSLGGKLTKDKCREIANKCKNRTELERKHGGVYNKSLRLGWLDDFFPKAA
jgi:predicted GIY-YIG superfamily endonuclease